MKSMISVSTLWCYLIFNASERSFHSVSPPDGSKLKMFGSAKTLQTQLCAFTLGQFRAEFNRRPFQTFSPQLLAQRIFKLCATAATAARCYRVVVIAVYILACRLNLLGHFIFIEGRDAKFCAWPFAIRTRKNYLWCLGCSEPQ